MVQPLWSRSRSGTHVGKFLSSRVVSESAKGRGDPRIRGMQLMKVWDKVTSFMLANQLVQTISFSQYRLSCHLPKAVEIREIC